MVPQTRIVGGQEARAGQFPYAASIQTPQHSHICGGAIISARWVLTVASCTINLWVGDGAFTVRTGTNQYNNGGVVHQVSALVNHAEFDFNTRRNDIAAIQTQTAIASNANTKPIALPRADTGAGASAVIIGWGYTDPYNPRKSSQLQHLTTPIIGNEACRNELLSYGYSTYVRDTNVCTNAGYGMGVCGGDNGGPLTVGSELVGLMSFGVSCALGVPDVYTRVHSYLAWINANASG